MSEERCRQGLAVKAGTLNEFILGREMLGPDGEGLAIRQVHGCLLEKRRADGIGGGAWRHREESHHGEDNKGRHAATVLVAWHTQIAVDEIGIYEAAQIFLCLPGRSNIIIKIWYMEAGLVAHAELADEPG